MTLDEKILKVAELLREISDEIPCESCPVLIDSMIMNLRDIKQCPRKELFNEQKI